MFTIDYNFLLWAVNILSSESTVNNNEEIVQSQWPLFLILRDTGD